TNRREIRKIRKKPMVKRIPVTIKVIFESHDFNREKVISGNSEGVVFVGPLDAGEYKFFGEFNEKTAQGKLVVK
ncbi:MAG: cupredoxin domain-containing protein, partial [Rickettsiales bacterium]